MSKNLLITVIAVCLATAVTGWVHGRLTNRWENPPDLVSAAQRFDSVPSQVGDWEMVSNEPLTDEVVEMLQCAGHFSRVYKNPQTAESVTVSLIVGPPGPTAVHTPEICYSSRGQTIVVSPKPIAIRPETHPDESLWRMVFRSNGVEQNRFSVLYGWCGPDGHWSAATNARYQYGGQPLLYKIQLAGGLPTQSTESDDDVCQRFLKVFLPALDAALFRASVN
jgi:hypothetical protein